MPGFNIHDTGSRDPSATEEFHRAHRWAIETLGEPGGVTGATRSGAQPFVYAKSLKLPSLQFDEELIPGGSSNYSFAKVAVWQACEISFYDVFGLYSILKKWRELVWTPSGGLNVADAYKGNPRILLLDGNGNTTFSFELQGAWPKHLHHGELNYTSSEIKLVTVTFGYDFAIETENSNTRSR